jgi:UDP-N-acetylmuramoylalanine--D-glutamate ligase
MAALAVGHAWGLSWDAMRAPLSEYRPLPHRCEKVAVIGATEYINDSKATNLDALEKALRSESKPVVLIAGGKDKGFSFDTIASLVSQKCRSVVLIGEMAERIQSSWSPVVTCHVREGLREAVECAHSLAEPGDVVLFSPGTSSFDMFKNYADRGEQFRKSVLEIAQRKQVVISV